MLEADAVRFALAPLFLICAAVIFYLRKRRAGRLFMTVGCLHVLGGVWVGRDDFKPIGPDATGGQVALPIWLAYMREATRGQPARDFAPPPGIVFARADPDKGLPAPPSKRGSRLTPFRRGTLPPAFKTAASEARFSDERF